MSKYGAIIAEARKPENEQKKLANQKTGLPEKGKTIKPKNQKTLNTVKPPAAVKEAEVNLSIKVALRRRRYWMGQAKSKGETLTDAIINALSQRYGEPTE